MSKRNLQLNLPPTEVRSSERAEPAFRKTESDESAVDRGYILAAELFDAAMENTRPELANKEVSHLCGVSVSLVEKWRKPDTRACPSLMQMLLLPPAFHYALHKEMNRRFGFGRAALRDLLDAVGLVSLAVNQ